MQAGYSMVVADIVYEDQIIDNTFDEIGTYKFNRKNQLQIQKTKIKDRKIVGYYAVAKYRNFKAEIFWTQEEIDAHAYKYSDSLRYNIDKNLTGSTWQKEAEKMALKTMIRQVLGKNLVPNKKLLKAYEADMSAINLDGSLEYIDNAKTPSIKPKIDPRADKENVIYDNFMLFAIEKTKEKTAEDVESMLKNLESKRFREEVEANQIINALTENKDAGIIAEDKAIVLENYIKKITITEK
jgi:recombinational DNA repair protein RecT